METVNETEYYNEENEIQEQDPRKTTMKMIEFLDEYGNSIKEKIKDKLVPLFQRNNRDEWDDKALTTLFNLARKPFPAQAETIVSVAKSLFYKDKKSAFLVGEMGTGKTLMGVGISSLMPKKNARIFIMCPSHLVDKWRREIFETDKGAKNITIITSISDVILKKPVGREYCIISKERAKLHYTEKLSVLTKPTYAVPFCPDCGSSIDMENNDKNIKKCPVCNTPLYSADNTKFRRYAVSEYIKRHKKYFKIDLLILDEVHEYKSGETAQGQAMHALISASSKIVALTGTLMGGYASNLYYLLFRLFTRKMIKHGYKHNSAVEFSKEYGMVEEVETISESKRTASIGRTKTTKKVQEKPGISPLLLPHFLLEDSVYLWISDISSELPSYEEDVEIISMTDEQYAEYKTFEQKLICEVQMALSRKDNRLLGALVNSLYALPDGARRGEIVYEPDNHEVELCSAKPLDIEILPKEKRLQELVLAEKSKGRKCAIFLEHTGTRDLIPDIVERLNNIGIKSLILRSDTVTSIKRESWLKQQIKKTNPDILICNPNLVKTGLDLLEFPTIIYFQTGMSIYTLRQSSRRSWRIGQRKPVKVIFLAYEDTAQERAMRLIATKLETSNAIEGKLSADGLSAMSAGDSSMVIAMARSLMGNDNDKRSFGDIWSSYKKSEITSNESIFAEEGQEKNIDYSQYMPSSPLYNAQSKFSSNKVVVKTFSLSAIMNRAEQRKTETKKGKNKQLTMDDILGAMDELYTISM